MCLLNLTGLRTVSNMKNIIENVSYHALVSHIAKIGKHSYAFSVLY